MTNQAVDTIAAGISMVVGTGIGSKALPLLANTADQNLPTWFQMLIGPAGALVGLVVALWWMTQRLNRAETRFEEREKERDNDRKQLIIVVEQNSQALREVSSVIIKCKGQPNHEL